MNNYPEGEDMAENRESAARGEYIALTPLTAETRAALSTREAAAHLGRAQQTLRIWACREIGPLQPLRVNGRLAWRVNDLRRLLGVEAGQ